MITEYDHVCCIYDRAGNLTGRTNETNHNFDESYVYDDLNRLTSTERADDVDQSWGLDGLGNFSTFNDDGTSQTRTVNEVNQIQTISGSAGWKTPEYDAAGSMIFAPKSGDETTGLHFVRDAWNRQVAVYEDDGDGVFEPGAGDTLVAKYEFDGANRRIEKTFADDTGVEYFYNQQWQLLEERTLTSDSEPLTSVNQYVWSPRYIDAPVVRFHDGNGDGDVLDAGDNTHYYMGDANFNVTATIDAATGDVVNRYAYSAYGEATVYSPTWTSPAAVTEDGPGYCGYFFDAETGNSRVRFREYITSASTFDATDPIGIAGGINLYGYANDSPLTRTDPYGLQTRGTGGITWPDPMPPVPVTTHPPMSVCKGNARCEVYLSELLKFVADAPGSTWWEPCHSWQGDIWGKLPLKFSQSYVGSDKSPFSVQRVFWVVKGCWTAIDHAAFKVTFPDGSVYYFDEGGPWSTFAGALGGPDRWFTDEDIPSNYVPTPSLTPHR